tara:strand:- start:522 stop:731 length:210 start_codon:yes stop_codon:yes gene_type:complete
MQIVRSLFGQRERFFTCLISARRCRCIRKHTVSATLATVLTVEAIYTANEEGLIARIMASNQLRHAKVI